MEKEIQLALLNTLREYIKKDAICQMMDTEVAPNMNAYDLYENLCCYLGSNEDIEP